MKKRIVFVVLLSLLFVVSTSAAVMDGGYDSGKNEGPGQISRNANAISETSAEARTARAAAGRAVRIARSSNARAKNAERLARANADRNDRQANHAHFSRDYGTTMWRHLWGDEGAPAETRKVHRENGGFSGLLWGNQPPTEPEFRRFSNNGGLVGTVLFNEGRLDTHAIALWAIGLIAIAALLLHLPYFRRSRGESEDEDEEAPPENGGGETREEDDEAPSPPEETDEETPAEEEEEPEPPPPSPGEVEEAVPVPEGDEDEDIGDEPDDSPPPVPDDAPELNDEGGEVEEAPAELDEW